MAGSGGEGIEACRACGIFNATLKRWREQNPDATPLDKVFAVSTSFKTAWSVILKAAGIKRFRWHDLRHHFASRLVQADVNLNTVRELLGHGSLAMTLRYAHLGPDQKRAAVALLCSPREEPAKTPPTAALLAFARAGEFPPPEYSLPLPARGGLTAAHP